MTDEADPLADHGLHEQVEVLETRVHALDLTDTPEAHEDGHRLREVLAYTRVRARSATAPLVSPAMLDLVATQLEAVETGVGQFEADRNAAYLEQAATACDGLLKALAPIPPAAPTKEVAATRQAASRYREDMEEILDALRDKAKAIDDRLDAAGKRLDEDKDASAAAVSGVKEELEGVRASIAEQTTRVDEALSAFSDQSSAELKAARNAFETATADAVQTAQREAAEQLSSFKESSEASSAAYKESADAVIARLNELRDQAANLVGVVTGTATAGDFKIVADNERDTANKWRLAAVLSVIAVACIGIWILVAAASDQPFGWDRLAAKAFVTVPLAGLAAYAGNQSSGHRGAERQARYSQLQLAALEPYVEALDDEEAQKVRATLAQHLFGPPPAAALRTDEEAVTATVLAQLLERALNAAVKR